jgi:hypothetical protein
LVDFAEQKHMYLIKVGYFDWGEGDEAIIHEKSQKIIHSLPRFTPQKILRMDNDDSCFFIMRDMWTGKWYTIANSED